MLRSGEKSEGRERWREIEMERERWRERQKENNKMKDSDVFNFLN